MPTTIEITGLKIGIALALMLAVAGSTWFAADAHYSQKYTALASADHIAQQMAHQQEIKDNYVTKEVNDEAVHQLNDLLAANTDLGLRLAARRRVVAPIAMSCQPVREADGRGTPETAQPAAADAQPVAAVDVAVDAKALDDSLRIGIDAIDEILLFRAYERGTGHSPQPIVAP